MNRFMSEVGSIAAYHGLRLHSKKVIYLLVLAGLLFLAAALFLTDFDLGPQEILVIDAGLSLIGFFAFLFSCYLGITVFYEELERKHLYSFLVRVNRFQYLLGMVLALVLSLLIALAFLYLELSFILFHLSGKWPGFLMQSFLAQFFEGIIWINLTLFFSLLATSNLNFSLCLGAFILSRIPFQAFANIPFPPIRWLAFVLKGALPQLALLNTKDSALQMMSISWVPFSGALLYAFLYGTLLFLGTHLVFQRKNL